MTDQQEIVFWKKAKKLILDGYGNRHCPVKDTNLDCPQCRAVYAVAWINGHLNLLDWATKKVKTFKKK